MSDSSQRFPSPFLLLLKVNLLQAWRRVTQAGSRSGTLSFMVAVFLIFYPLIASGLFWAGLRYVSKFPGLGDLLIEHLVFLLFAMLFMLLLFSNVVVGYTNMFRIRKHVFCKPSLSRPTTSSNGSWWKPPWWLRGPSYC